MPLISPPRRAVSRHYIPIDFPSAFRWTECHETDWVHRVTFSQCRHTEQNVLVWKWVLMYCVAGYMTINGVSYVLLMHIMIMCRDTNYFYLLYYLLCNIYKYEMSSQKFSSFWTKLIAKSKSCIVLYTTLLQQ